MENQKQPNVTVRGPVGDRVARNVTTRREELGLSQRDVAVQVRYLEGANEDELSNAQLRNTINSISKIEKRKKRVDVDDLTTLAIALKTTPSWLMYHEDPVSPTRPVKVYPANTLRQEAVTNWANGRSPLPWADSPTLSDRLKFRETHRPFEPNEFPARMPEAFEDSEQYRILRKALEDVLATGASRRYIVPMMFEVVNRHEAESFDFDEWIDGTEGDSDA